MSNSNDPNQNPVDGVETSFTPEDDRNPCKFFARITLEAITYNFCTLLQRGGRRFESVWLH